MTSKLDSKNRSLQSVFSFLQNRTQNPSSEEIHLFLENNRVDYPVLLFMLSDSYNVLPVEYFRRSFLYSNLENFTLEELFYIVESIKNQISLGFDDFFLVMHLFFTKFKIFEISNLTREEDSVITSSILETTVSSNSNSGNNSGNSNNSIEITSLNDSRTKIMENFFIFLLQNFDYKMREFFISGHLCFYSLKTSIEDTPTIFHLKLIKKLLESENEVLNSYLEKLNLQINIKKLKGACKFFKRWYETQGKNDTKIQITFKS